MKTGEYGPYWTTWIPFGSAPALDEPDGPHSPLHGRRATRVETPVLTLVGDIRQRPEVILEVPGDVLVPDFVSGGAL